MKPKRKGTWFEPNLPSLWLLRIAQVGPNNTDPQLTDGQPKRNVTSITSRSEGVQAVLWCRGCFFLMTFYMKLMHMYAYHMQHHDMRCIKHCSIRKWYGVQLAFFFGGAMSHMFCPEIPVMTLGFSTRNGLEPPRSKKGSVQLRDANNEELIRAPRFWRQMVFAVHPCFMRSFYIWVWVQAYAAIIFIIFEHYVCFGRWLLHCWHGWYIHFMQF